MYDVQKCTIACGVLQTLIIIVSRPTYVVIVNPFIGRVTFLSFISLRAERLNVIGNAAITLLQCMMLLLRLF